MHMDGRRDHPRFEQPRLEELLQYVQKARVVSCVYSATKDGTCLGEFSYPVAHKGIRTNRENGKTKNLVASIRAVHK